MNILIVRLSAIGDVIHGLPVLAALKKKYPEANGWFPLKASVEDMVVLINKEQGKVIAIVDLRPWNS